MNMYTREHAEILEKFAGLWKDQHGNIVYIQSDTRGHFTASFGLGTTHAPFVRRCFRNALTVDMAGEFRPAWGTFAIQFGHAYRGPELHVAYCRDADTDVGYLEPSYVGIESATDAERECYDLIRGVDDLYPVNQAEWDEHLVTYHLTDGEMTNGPLRVTNS